MVLPRGEGSIIRYDVILVSFLVGMDDDRVGPLPGGHTRIITIPHVHFIFYIDAACAVFSNAARAVYIDAACES